jgi:hypothetical protein
VSTLTCGGKSSSYEYSTIALESIVSGEFRQLNFTKRAVYYEVEAFESEEGDHPYSMAYINVRDCPYSDSIVCNRRTVLPRLEFANFCGNTPAKYLLQGTSNRGMPLRECVFSGNTGPLIYSASGKFDVDHCSVSDGLPSMSYGILGDHCYSSTSAPASVVFAINSHGCPAIRPASASRSPLPTDSIRFAPSQRLTPSQAFSCFQRWLEQHFVCGQRRFFHGLRRECQRRSSCRFQREWRFGYFKATTRYMSSAAFRTSGRNHCAATFKANGRVFERHALAGIGGNCAAPLFKLLVADFCEAQSVPADGGIDSAGYHPSSGSVCTIAIHGLRFVPGAISPDKSTLGDPVSVVLRHKLVQVN